MKSETELIRKATQGDRPAIRDLLAPLEHPVFAYLRKMLGNEADAEDVAQDVFVTIIHRLDQFQYRGTFRAWVFQIAHRRGLNWIRDHRKTAAVIDAEIHAPGPDSAAMAETEEIRQLVGQAVGQLSQEQQSVIWLRVKSNLSFREIAQVTGEPLGTVLSRMHQAKSRLAKLLQSVNQ